MSPRLPVAANLLAASLLSLAACSGHKAADVDAANANAEATTPKARQKTVFDDQLKALDQAKAVEKQLQEDKEKADQAIKDAGG